MPYNRIPHAKHVRHASYDRMRHAGNFKSFIDDQAERLSLEPNEVLDELMKKQGLSAAQVAAQEVRVGPGNTSAPTISGTTVVGQVLTANDGTWEGTEPITFSYVWRRAGADIAGATSKTYTLMEGDVDALITVVVTATNVVESVTYESAAVGPVTAAE